MRSRPPFLTRPREPPMRPAGEHAKWGQAGGGVSTRCSMAGGDGRCQAPQPRQRCAALWSARAGRAAGSPSGALGDGIFSSTPLSSTAS